MTAGKVAVLFPGQGAYYQGALTNVLESFPEVRAVLEEIDAVSEKMLNERVSDNLTNGKARPLDELLADAPDLLQLAIYGISVAAFGALRGQGLRPEVLIGHSFGEIAALVSAGAFTAGEGAEIVCHRTAALRAAGVPDGGMAALSADAATARRILDLVGDADTVIAVENHAGQTVVSGGAAAVAKAGAVAAALGLAARPVKSPYPFHSPLLADAVSEFGARIRHLTGKPLELPVFSPILSRRYTDADDLTAALAGHLVQPVRFADAVRAVHAEGVTVFVESGALDALTTIARRVVGDTGLTAVPSLSPMSGIGAAITGLAEAGVLAPAEVDDVLHRVFAPDLDVVTFQRAWRANGARIIDLIRRELVDVAGTTAAGAVPLVGAAASPSFASPAIVPAPPVSALAAVAPVTGGGVTAGDANGRPTAVSGAAADGSASAVSAAPAAETAPAAAGSTPSRSQLLRELTSFYADALEYPSEVFDEDTDLEAELGVDSVKQTELLGRVGAQYGLPPRPADFKVGDHNTLGRIADLIIAA
ncbi:acyltransferase domain-containing protein [Nocardia puris]|uniref:[acyl-carrier-protein] S-malonyltransferase n=2 Tax=Nocardia puris TaxID=208602 RepID=A0A366DLE7_9NOCA|nr:acyltransferase domain-containing protein [Nocardia puris]MBF6212888.1 acyltransferase domain-containing protein [Nocardia puris]MBF6367879.1 acyltransferase domain-containing protein [Nocardia puris]MBF6463228.1 acyltransferase domain-containing protein [Nocardia puris]RBO90134.1 malonyl CoA-acyl carrier protein transacylase [Nocardia puris]